MNNVCEIGRLTSDVELKMTPSGKSVCSFTIAVYRTKEITDFLPCVAWRQTAERTTPIPLYCIKSPALRQRMKVANYIARDKARRGL